MISSAQKCQLGDGAEATGQLQCGALYPASIPWYKPAARPAAKLLSHHYTKGPTYSEG